MEQALDFILNQLHSIRKQLNRIESKEDMTTQQTKDLLAAVAKVGTDIGENNTAEQAAIARLEAAVTPGNDPDVDAAIASLKTISATTEDHTAKLAAIGATPVSTTPDPTAPATTIPGSVSATSVTGAPSGAVAPVAVVAPASTTPPVATTPATVVPATETTPATTTGPGSPLTGSTT